MRRVASAFGFKMTRTVQEKHSLSDFEQQLASGAPIKGLGPVATKSWKAMPKSVQSSLASILAEHTKKVVQDGSSN